MYQRAHGERYRHSKCKWPLAGRFPSKLDMPPQEPTKLSAIRYTVRRNKLAYLILLDSFPSLTSSDICWRTFLRNLHVGGYFRRQSLITGPSQLYKIAKTEMMATWVRESTVNLYQRGHNGGLRGSGVATRDRSNAIVYQSIMIFPRIQVLLINQQVARHASDCDHLGIHLISSSISRRIHLIVE